MGETVEFVHISELVRGSAVYDTDNNRESLVFHRVHVMATVSLVKYEFEGNQFIDVWSCRNGEVHIDDIHEPTHSYNIDDHNGYDTLNELLDGSPIQEMYTV